jgi:uncharacterized membrane protein SpoIIM required for sporulation
MRETEFIDQNKDKWLELERLGASKAKDPEKLSELFIEATNDLSFSKSYYPSRSIRVYLNNLALNVHSNVYRTRQSTWKRVKKLWLEQIPRAYYESRRAVLFSFIIFFLSMFVGVFSSMQDPGFVGLMFSEQYIEMTLENIKEGRPFGVYASESHMDLFTYVTLNNIKVSFVVFVLGLFFMVGTVGALIHNGAMLGAFHYLFYENGLLGESLITVWMHGMPEISAIILAGAAGLELGKGLIFPGTYTRKESFLLGAKKGVLMIIGVVPVFLFAGFVEGFATRYTDIPDLVRIVFILVCAAFILTYFVIMPRVRFKGKFNKSVAEEQIPDSADHDFKLDQIKRHGEVFSDTFAVYSSKFSSFILPAVAFASLYIAGLFFLLQENFIPHFTALYVPSLGDFFTAVARAFIKVDQLYELTSFPVLYVMNTLLIAGMVLYSMKQLEIFFRNKRNYIRPVSRTTALVWTVLISALAHTLFFIPSPFSFFLILGLSPFLLFAVCAVLIPEHQLMSAGELYRIAIRHGYRRLLGMTFVLFCCSSLFMIFFNSGLTDYLLQTILSGVKMEERTYETIMVMVNISFATWSLLMVIPLYLFATYFSFWSAYEIETAESLKENISHIGVREKAYGILREEV